MQELLGKYIKTQLKGITEDLNKWRKVPCLEIVSINIVYMLIISILLISFNLNTCPTDYIMEFDKIFLKFI